MIPLELMCLSAVFLSRQDDKTYKALKKKYDLYSSQFAADNNLSTALHTPWPSLKKQLKAEYEPTMMRIKNFGPDIDDMDAWMAAINNIKRAKEEAIATLGSK